MVKPKILMPPQEMVQQKTKVSVAAKSKILMWKVCIRRLLSFLTISAHRWGMSLTDEPSVQYISSPPLSALVLKSAIITAPLTVFLIIVSSFHYLGLIFTLEAAARIASCYGTQLSQDWQEEICSEILTREWLVIKFFKNDFTIFSSNCTLQIWQMYLSWC